MFSFDGVNDFVDVPVGTASFTAGITMEAWVYLDTPAEMSINRAILTNRTTGADVQFSLHLDTANHQLTAGFYVQNVLPQWFTARVTTGLSPRRWTHVA